MDKQLLDIVSEIVIDYKGGVFDAGIDSVRRLSEWHDGILTGFSVEGVRSMNDALVRYNHAKGLAERKHAEAISFANLQFYSDMRDAQREYENDVAAIKQSHKVD